jgi:hypothetical protein
VSNFALASNTRFSAVGANTGSSIATNINGSGTAFVKSSWVVLTTSWPFDSEGVIVMASSPSAGVAMFTLDIARGATGSELPVISDLWCPETTSLLTEYIPLRIKAGEQIQARINSDQVFVNLQVQMFPIGGSTRRMFGYGGGNRWQTNLNTGTLRGTQVDPGSTTNTKGAWTTLISSTNGLVTTLMLTTRGWHTVNAQTNCLIDIGIGAAGSEQVLIPNMYQFNQPNSSNWTRSYLHVPVALPPGTRLAARAQADSNDSNDRLCEVFCNVIA